MLKSRNEKFIDAIAKHIPSINIERLRVRLAPLDIDARYTAACMTMGDMRDFGTAAQQADACRKLDAVSKEREAILKQRK